MKALNMVSLILVIVGGINWGLVGVFNVDLVALIFGAMSLVSKIIYILVGLSAINMIFIASKCKCCVGGTCSSASSQQM